MLLDLISGQPLVRVGLQDFIDEVDALRGQALRHLKLTAEDFLVQLGRGFVFKGQVARDHREKNDTAGPDIDARAIVLQSVDHFGCCVAGRSTCRLKQLSLFVLVAQSEIYKPDVLLMI